MNMSNSKRLFVCLNLSFRGIEDYCGYLHVDLRDISNSRSNKQILRTQKLGLSLNMSNSKRFFVCLILSLLLPKSTSAQIVDQRDDMNWTFFMAVTWTVEPIQDLNFILGMHFD